MARRISDAKLALQGGLKKRGFWKDPETLEVLRQYKANEITLADAATLLATTPGAVNWYAGTKKKRVAKPTAALIEHGASQPA